MIDTKADANHQNKHIVIFASGNGSNAQKIIDHFRNEKMKVNVVLIVCNNKKAGVLKIAEKENIPCLIIEKNKFIFNGYINELKKYHVDLIILAGFLWKIPLILIQSFPKMIINIHPALLPKFGGKNMYGNYVHEAVLKAKENESGITIHYVDEIYDNGEIIFQAKCAVGVHETTNTLAEKIHVLEHKNYPVIIEKILRSQ